MHRREFVKGLLALGITAHYLAPNEVMGRTVPPDTPIGVKPPIIDTVIHGLDHFELDMTKLRLIRSEVSGVDNTDWEIEFYCDDAKETSRIVNYLMDWAPYTRDAVPVKVTGLNYAGDDKGSARAKIKDITIRTPRLANILHYMEPPVLVRFTLHYEGEWA